MSKAIEAFNNLPTTSNEVAAFSRLLIDEIENGQIDALQFKIFLKHLDTVLANIKPSLDKAATSEADKYGQRSFELLGAKVEMRELATKYSFDGCGYPVWERCDVAAKKAAEDKKAAEEFLKSLKSKISINDEETGEVCEVYPPIKSSTTGIVITLPKPKGNE
jgi:hypothetical protein